MESYKFREMLKGNFAPFSYPNIYQQERAEIVERLVMTPSSDHVDLMIALSRLMAPPFGILYVLVVPRMNGNKPGRYQNPNPASREEMEAFLNHFRLYFELDGRHHIWIASRTDSSQLIYDRHNVIYGYGPLGEFEEVLGKGGMSAGIVRIPSPHSHNYNEEFDQSSIAQSSRTTFPGL